MKEILKKTGFPIKSADRNVNKCSLINHLLLVVMKSIQKQRIGTTLLVKQMKADYYLLFVQSEVH